MLEKQRKVKYSRYLGTKFDEIQTEKSTYMTSKLNRANVVLAKLRHFVYSKTLKTNNFANFYSHLNYVCIDWKLTRFPQQKVSIFQKAPQVNMIFTPFNATLHLCSKIVVFLSLLIL